MASVCYRFALKSGYAVSRNILQQAYRGSGVIAQQRMCYADMAFTFASPASVYYKEADVKQIDVPTMSGDFGILPNHVPLLAVLRPGVISVHENDGGLKKYFVSSGSVTINDDSSVQILAEEACPVDHLDAQAIRDGAAKAAQDLLSASSDQSKAEAQITVECYDALQKAVEHAHR